MICFCTPLPCSFSSNKVKVFTDDEGRRTGLYFDPSASPYLSAKEEKEAEEKSAAQGKAKGASGPKKKRLSGLAKEGGIDVVVVCMEDAYVQCWRSLLSYGASVDIE